jgi:aminoglycoside phosphotransferase (APT) family kinase protein
MAPPVLPDAVRALVTVTVGVPVDVVPLGGGFSGMQVARVVLEGEHDVVVKWTDDGPDSRAGHAVQREAEALAHLRAHRFDQVAASVAADPAVPALVMQTVTGGPASAWDAGVLGAAARTLADLAEVPASGLRPLPATDVAKPRPHLADRVRRALPHDAALAQDLLEAYWSVSAASTAPEDLVATHADPHPGNWMLDAEGGLRLIDLEHLCAGPPGWDLAYLCAHLPGPADDRAEVLAATGHPAQELLRLTCACTALLVAGTLSPDPAWAARQQSLAPAALELVRLLRA